jgi:hypothetical protein
VLLAWGAQAGADDLLARKVHLDIPAEPLGQALIQLGTQARIGVGASDADVAHFQSQALKGDYTLIQALTLLLEHTGLSFSPVGSDTVVIRSADAPLVARTPAGGAAATQQSEDQRTTGEAVNMLMRHTGMTYERLQYSTVPLPPRESDVNIITPGPLPSEQQLAGDSLFQFILHHGTTHGSQVNPGGPLRWRGGRPESICPLTVGLDRAHNDFITARIRTVAAYVGAPLATGPRCEPNVEVIFTSNPHVPIETFMHRAAVTPGIEVPRPIEAELEATRPHAIQGWYLAAGGGGSILNKDAPMVPGRELRGLWPYVIPSSRHTIDRDRSILAVELVVDTPKLAGTAMGALADYLAVVSLVLVQSPDHCDPLPSILDLMSSTCNARTPPSGITAADVAFLKEVYYRDTGLKPARNVSELTDGMRKELCGKP